MLRTLFTLLLSTAFLLTLSAQQMEIGMAAYYADYLHGQATAMGETYDRNAFTCAHRFHPKGTLLRVTNFNNQKSVVVRVNDRGPYKDEYVVDLSLAAANAIDLTLVGKAKVGVEPIGFSNQPVNSKGEPIPGAQVQSFTRSKPVATSPTPASGGDKITKRGLPPRNYAFEIGKNNNTSTTTAYTSEIKRIQYGQPGYVIQIGAYSSYDNAGNQIRSIQQRGVTDVYLLESRSADGTDVYRVVLGVFDQQDFAERYRQRLKSQYKLNGIVVSLQK